MSNITGVSSSQRPPKRRASGDLEDPDRCEQARRVRAELATNETAQIRESEISGQLTEIGESDDESPTAICPPKAPISHKYQRPLRRDDFQIAIICALPVEYNAVCLLIDQFWDEDSASYGRAPGDTNHYLNGRLGRHNVVLLQLAEMGKRTAAGSTASLRSSYTNIKLALLIGICGGVPRIGKREVLLGDVVIGEKIFQYDFGRQYHSKHVPRAVDEGNLGSMGRDIGGFIKHLKTDVWMQDVREKTAVYLKDLQETAMKAKSDTTYYYPGYSQDKLFTAAYQHKHLESAKCNNCTEEIDTFCRDADKTNCADLGCDEDMLVPRKRLKAKWGLQSKEEQQLPEIFVGHIASGDTVMRSSEHRDMIANSHPEKIIAFEMEGAGAFDEIPSIVIKGICDYADSHKNKEWQSFAAATAAAASKAVLRKYVLADTPVAMSAAPQADDKNDKCLADLFVTDPKADRSRIMKTKGGLLEDSYSWITKHTDFEEWTRGENRLLWITGDPGKGKTMLLCGIIAKLSPSTRLENRSADTLMPYFLFQGTDSRIDNATAALRSLIHMLIKQHPGLISYIREDYDKSSKQLFEGPNAWTTLSKSFTQILGDPGLKNINFIIDALDECTDRIKILDLITESENFSHVQWIISSRNTPDIAKKLEPLSFCKKLSLELEDNAKCVSEAVDSYIEQTISDLSSVLEKAKIKKAVVYETMRKKANGTFLWVSIFSQTLKKAKPWTVENVLNEFPSDLSNVYRRMVNQIEKEDAETRKLCSLVLSTLTIVYRPLHLKEIAVLSQLPKNISDLERIEELNLAVIEELVQTCGLFFTIREDFVYIIHQPAMDFLLKEGIDLLLKDTNWRAETNRGIFLRSLEALSANLQRDIYDIQDPGFLIANFKASDKDPLTPIRYSCDYWVNHLHEIRDCSIENYFNNNGEIDQFLRCHLLHWMEALSFTGRLREGIRLIILLESMAKAANRSKVYDFTHDAKRFLLYSVGIVEKAPLQIYFSALSFAPEHSLVRKEFEGEVTHCIDIVPVQQEWGPLLQTLQVHDSAVTAIALSPDGTTIASASDTGNVILCDLTTGLIQKTLERKWALSRELAFSSDGKKVLSIFDTGLGGLGVLLWDLTTKEVLGTYGWCRKRYDTVWLLGTPLPFSLGDGMFFLTAKFAEVGDKKPACKVSAQTIGPPWDRQHSTEITLEYDTLAFSPDGKTIAFVDSEGLKLRDISSGTVTELFRNSDLYETPDGPKIGPFSFSPDGTLIALAFHDTVKIVDLQEKPVKFSKISLCCQNSIYGISFSPNSKVLACALGDNTVRLWDVGAGVPLQSLTTNDGLISLIIFSPDGKMVATASCSGVNYHIRARADVTIRLWDATTGICLRSLEGQNWSLSSMAFVLDPVIALASGDGIIQLWNTMTGELMPAIESPVPRVMIRGIDNLSFSPDGKSVAASQVSSELCMGSIRIWDLETGIVLHTLEARGKPNLDDMLFSPNGQKLATAFEQPPEIAFEEWNWHEDENKCWNLNGGLKIHLWDVTTGKLLYSLEYPDFYFRSMAFSPDGRTMAVALKDALFLLDPETGSVQKKYESGRSDWCQIVYSPCGKTIISSFVGTPSHGASSYAEIWCISTKEPLFTRTKIAEVELPSKSIITLSPHGKKFYVMDYTRVDVYDAATGVLLNTLIGYNESVRNMGFSLDENIAISKGYDCDIRVWELGTATISGITSRLPIGFNGYIKIRAVSRNNKIAAVVTGKYEIRLWDTNTGMCIPTTGKIPDGEWTSIALSPDGTAFAYASTSKILLHTFGTEKRISDERVLWQKHRSKLVFAPALVFSSDSKTIITMSSQRLSPFIDEDNHSGYIFTNTFNVYDVLSGRRLKEFQCVVKHHRMFPLDFRCPLSRASLSQNGKLAIIIQGASSDKIEIRDNNFRLLHSTLEIDGCMVIQMAFSPDNNMLAVLGVKTRNDPVGSSYKISIWNVATGALLRDFHDIEWTSILNFSPDGKYLRTEKKMFPLQNNTGVQGSSFSNDLFVIDGWIALGERIIFQLPIEYLRSPITVSSNLLMINATSGQCLFMRSCQPYIKSLCI
ncbi:hypothetical protein TWF730_002504 [Orbilia blumenaviensis]|uniref:NACHT domain-containing protein n=1 Tax=Orbilia blumenaviensis TaxID=1796055 RepID=A0AAV9UDK3_9PEZI